MWYMQAKKQMIFSISGWRSILSKKETPFIIDDEMLTCIYYGLVSYIQAKQQQEKLHIAIGCDARLSGIVLLALAKLTLKHLDCNISMLGMIPVPAIMAYTATHTDGFIYFTASHNPEEYNGIKFGAAEGKTQSQKEHKKMMDIFYEYTNSAPEIPSHITAFQNTLHTLPSSLSEMQIDTSAYTLAKETYKKLVIESVFKGIDNPSALLKQKLSLFEKKHSGTLAVLWDPNGGARSWEGDDEILSSFGIESLFINKQTSHFNHAIIPEGESLQQVKNALMANSSFDSTPNDTAENYIIPFAVACDCDGDRGNTIFSDTTAAKTRNSDRAKARSKASNSDTQEKTPPLALAAQEVFAMILHIELAWDTYIQKKTEISHNTAIGINGPSSLRCNLISEKHNAEVHRGEVGEANIVSLGEHLLQSGFHVPMVGEASNGGVIMFPSKSRDPLCTILSLIKGLLWADEIGLDTHLINILHSLPKASTSHTEDPLAKFQLPDMKYQDICSIILTSFDNFFPKFQACFSKYGIEHIDYSFVNFTGRNTHHIQKNAPLKNSISSGGLAVYFYKERETRPFAFIWLRPSGTEPVVRLLADILLADAPLTDLTDKREEIPTQLLVLWRAYLDSVLAPEL